MCLTRETGDAPTSDDAFGTVTSGDGNGVNDFVLLEDTANGDWLLHQTVGKVDLLVDGTTVDLNFHDVGLLLIDRDLFDLGVADEADGTAMLLEFCELCFNFLLAIGVLLHVLGEGLLLGLVPVLIKATLHFVREMFSPDGVERTEATSGLNVADNTDSDHWRGLNDGDSFNGFLLVELGAWTLDIADDVGHAGLVAHEGGEMWWFGSIVLGEGFYLTLSTLATLLRQEAKRTVTGVLELWGR